MVGATSSGGGAFLVKSKKMTNSYSEVGGRVQWADMNELRLLNFRKVWFDLILKFTTPCLLYTSDAADE